MRLSISKLLFLFLISAVFLNAETLSRTKVALGTFVSISLDLKNKKYIEDGFGIINDVELSLSSYKPQAKIYQLNENKTVDLDRYTYEALLLSRKYYEKSDGYFNIAIGKVTKDLYRFGEEEKVPTNAEVMKVNLDYRNLYFSKTKAFLYDGIKIDLGGMGKGFAVDKVTEYFKSKNIDNVIVAASGDIRCLSECEIEVADPFSEETLLSFSTLAKEMGVSTSGNYNRYVKSIEHNHLINPKLKKSQLNFISITLISEISNSDLDAYATATSVMPLQKAYQFLDSLDLAYIIMQSDKVLRYSENINTFTKNLVINNRVKK